MHSQTLKALSDALAAGDVSSQELTQHFLDRIKQHDPAVNSFITDTEGSSS